LEIIHSADIWYPYTYQAVKTGIPTVVTEWENIPFNIEELPYAKIKRYNLDHITHFIAVTEKAKKALITEGAKEEKISVIPAGLDCEKFKPSQKNTQLTKQFGVAEDSTKILFVGRLVLEKGIFDLLKAFSMLLANNHQNLELLVVGSGTLKSKREIIELMSSLKITQRVKLLGSIKYSDMPQIHNMADIFCLPSVETKVWAEQFGYSIVEAMSCAKPVVSTFTGSIPEIVKHHETGILVEPNFPTALKVALEELVVDKVKREHFGKAGRDWVLNRFEASKVACQIAEIYRKYIYS
jgi:alpha-maltose-1-phosphate synthase